MTAQRARLVLHDNVTENHLTAVAGTHDWWMKRRIGRSGDQPNEYIYATDDDRTEIHFIEDHKIGVAYLLVTGADTGQVMSVLEENLSHHAPVDIRDDARNEMEPVDLQRSLYHLALTNMETGFDPEVFEIYRAALAHPDPDVRGSAVLGSAYLGWRELAEPIGALAGPAEPDESVRRDAELLSGRLMKLKPKGKTFPPGCRSGAVAV